MICVLVHGRHGSCGPAADRRGTGQPPPIPAATEVLRGESSAPRCRAKRVLPLCPDGQTSPRSSSSESAQTHDVCRLLGIVLARQNRHIAAPLCSHHGCHVVWAGVTEGSRGQQREPEGTGGNQREPEGARGNRREAEGTRGNQREPEGTPGTEKSA